MTRNHARASARYAILYGIVGLAFSGCTTEPTPSRVDDSPTARTIRPASRTLTEARPFLVAQPQRSQEFWSNLPTQRASEAPQLVWISLDGLQQDMLKGFVSRERARSKKEGRPLALHPQGIASLLKRSKNWTPLQVTDPTITASSHTSTMTCVPPGQHGIIGNSQWNGTATESGFDKIHKSDTFVSALRRAGKKVSVIGYPGFDGRSENRLADVSVSYARSQGRSQMLAVSARSETPLELVAFLPPNADGSPAQWPLKVVFTLEENAQQGTVWLVSEDNNRQPLGVVGTEDWTSLLWDQPLPPDAAGDAPVRSARKMIQARLFSNTTQTPSEGSLPGETTKDAILYLSAATANVVRPPTLAAQLDAKGVIFPAGKDFKVLEKLGDNAFLQTLETNLRYFTTNAHEALSQPDTDALFLYFESLDVLGHQYAGSKEKLPFVDEHLRIFDKALGSLLARLGPSTNVVLVGDHGMSAIQFELNALELLPETSKSLVQARTSGGALFVYGSDPKSLTTQPPRGEAWFEDLVTQLKTTRLPGKPEQLIFSHVWVKGSPEARAMGWQDDTPMPWVIATASVGMGLVTSVEPGLLQSLRKGARVPKELLDKSVKHNDPATGLATGHLPEPEPLGQHGHASEHPDMLTHVVAYGPLFEGRLAQLAGARQTSQPVKKDSAPVAKNLALVPFVADLLNWPRPEGCLK
jgi:predicted AlkP superfamily pyrophosphatase or phosphodiesterase